MTSDRVFQITILISLAAHGAILSLNPGINPYINKKTEEKLEVSYLQELKNPRQQVKVIPLKKELPLDLSAKITAQKIPPPPFIDRESIFKENKENISRKYDFIKPALVKPDIIAVKKKITLPAVDIDKINNPSYISYYQIVREKIRRSAYSNYTGIETGEIYLSFVISSNGSLKETRLIAEKSTPSAYLEETALKSIKGASPFPAFPKELSDYPQLSFKVIISFGIE